MTNLLVTHFNLKSSFVIVKFLVYHSSSPSIIEIIKWQYISFGLGNASPDASVQMELPLEPAEQPAGSSATTCAASAKS